MKKRFSQNEKEDKSRLKILVVEDDTETVDWLIERAQLETSASYCQAGSIAEAFRAMENEVPDLVILDIHLPDGNGTELLKWLQQQNQVPVIFVFSVESSYRKACLRLGADRFFDKSANNRDLLHAIKNFGNGLILLESQAGENATARKTLL